MCASGGACLHACRAKRFAIRRVEQVQERIALLHGQPNVPGAASHVAAVAAAVTHGSGAGVLAAAEGLDPVAAGAAAEAEVKQVGMGACMARAEHAPWPLHGATIRRRHAAR